MIRPTPDSNASVVSRATTRTAAAAPKEEAHAVPQDGHAGSIEALASRGFNTREKVGIGLSLLGKVVLVAGTATAAALGMGGLAVAALAGGLLTTLGGEALLRGELPDVSWDSKDPPPTSCARRARWSRFRRPPTTSC